MALAKTWQAYCTNFFSLGPFEQAIQAMKVQFPFGRILKIEFRTKQWEEPGNKRNDKGCQGRISADHRGLSMVLSKSYESKLHFIFQEQMIPARENVLLPAFYKSNHWKFHMTLLSQSTQNTNHWNQRMTRWTDEDLLKVCHSNHLNSNVYINDLFDIASNRKYHPKS